MGEKAVEKYLAENAKVVRSGVREMGEKGFQIASAELSCGVEIQDSIGGELFDFLSRLVAGDRLTFTFTHIDKPYARIARERNSTPSGGNVVDSTGIEQFSPVFRGVEIMEVSESEMTTKFDTIMKRSPKEAFKIKPKGKTEENQVDIEQELSSDTTVNEVPPGL